MQHIIKFKSLYSSPRGNLKIINPLGEMHLSYSLGESGGPDRISSSPFRCFWKSSRVIQSRFRSMPRLRVAWPPTQHRDGGQLTNKKQAGERMDSSSRG